MTDNQGMGSLLSRMTEAGAEDFHLTDNQVTTVIEYLIPQIATSMPGMPPGMGCQVEAVENGWVIRVQKPSA